MSGVMIADQMGLGKTVQALAVLAATEAFPAVVVCPASLKLNWKKEIQIWLPDRTVEVVSGAKPSTGHRHADITVINYDILDSWVDHFDSPRAIVLDESHYIKNGTTIRTKAAIRLSDRMDDDAVRICLSGTPIVNTPSEVVTQLRFLHRINEFGGVGGFKKRYQRETNLVELNRKLRSICMVRRRKDDVLKELPPKRWSTITLTGDPAVMREYRKAEDNIVSYLAEAARKAAEESGATTDEAKKSAWQAALRAQSAEHLVAISALKRLATKAKIQSCYEWIEDFMATDSKLVVFAHHRHVVDEIAERYCDGLKITGEVHQDLRQPVVDRFQNEEAQQVLACSIKAAGVGLTLTAASDVLFIEQGWTPADMDQAADRCHRIGQTDSVTAWNMVCANTIDETISDLIARKRSVVDAATDGKGAESEYEGSVLGSLLIDLASRGIDPSS